MPIGLPDRVGPGGRGPERAVRPLLGERQSSVFSVPSRAAVMEDDYRRSCAVALADLRPAEEGVEAVLPPLPEDPRDRPADDAGARGAGLRGASRTRLLADQRRAADGAAEEGEEPRQSLRASRSAAISSPQTATERPSSSSRCRAVSAATTSSTPPCWRLSRRGSAAARAGAFPPRRSATARASGWRSGREAWLQAAMKTARVVPSRPISSSRLPEIEKRATSGSAFNSSCSVR